MKKRSFRLYVLFVIAPLALCGCISSHPPEGPALVVAGTELRLESSLKRVFQSDGRHFDLEGKLTIVAVNGSLPERVQAAHVSMKPSWKGYPWYPWGSATDPPKAWQPPKIEADRIVIHIIRRDLGGVIGEKPEHFAKYDVRVILFDGKSNRYVLTTAGVPTD
jgi:hypothetical protein